MLEKHPVITYPKAYQNCDIDIHIMIDQTDKVKLSQHP